MYYVLFDRFRRSDNLGFEIHDFASLPHNRFAFIGAIALTAFERSAVYQPETTINYVG